MKILIDNNVVMDVLFNREEHYEKSSGVFKMCEYAITGYISALSLADMFYVMRKSLNNEKIDYYLNLLKSIFILEDLTVADMHRAVKLDFKDYEDAVQTACAMRIDADYIVTRNTKDFKESPIPAVTPAEFIEIVGK